MDNAWVWMGDIVITITVLVIAYKSAHPLWWLALIPLANLWLMVDLADLPAIWLIFFFFPFINVLFYVYLWWRIAESTNKPGWLGLFMLVPFLNIAVALYMAFYEPEAVR